MNQAINSSTLGLIMLTAYQLNKEIVINENTTILEAWAVGGGIISNQQSKIPANPAFGDKYIIPAIEHRDKLDSPPNNDALNCEKASNNQEKCNIEQAELLKWTAGNVDKIALYADKWVYIKPKDGMMYWLIDAKAICIYYDGSWHIVGCSPVN